jgi:hypothetical protein
LDGAVNKRNLSTGETGEFASENVGSGMNPWGLSAYPRDHNFQNGETPPAKYLQSVWDTDWESKGYCQQNLARKFIANWYGSTLDTFRTFATRLAL